MSELGVVTAYLTETRCVNVESFISREHRKLGVNGFQQFSPFFYQKTCITLSLYFPQKKQQLSDQIETAGKLDRPFIH